MAGSSARQFFAARYGRACKVQELSEVIRTYPNFYVPQTLVVDPCCKQRSRNCVRLVPLLSAALRLAQVRGRHQLGYAVARTNQLFTIRAG